MPARFKGEFAGSFVIIERLPGQGRKIASFDRLRMQFCSLWHLWVIIKGYDII